MYRNSHCKCSRAKRGSGTVVIAASLLLAAASSAPAQTSSPGIAAEERRDPASGEVVIINRKKRKRSAPDPYAPIKRKPAEREQAATSAPAKTAAPAKPIIRRENAVPRVKPNGSSPQPQLNPRQRAATARLRRVPQADLGAPEGRGEELLAPRHAVRPPPRPRAVPRSRRYSERYRSGRRPRRQCRTLARRCQAGFEGSCYIWQRRCT